jgi:hypothetical protein
VSFSAAFEKYRSAVVGAEVLSGFYDHASSASPNQLFTNSCLLSASVAQAVGCWEGYLEAVLREFVSKTRVQAHRRAWPLIVQFESLVDKMASELNTPSWEKCRDLVLNVTGMDVYPSWIWTGKFSNQTDTKAYFDGILRVRHSFAHGFPVPNDVPGLILPGKLDPGYVADAISCLNFFAVKTDALLEHELMHRHGCSTGWR